MENRERWRIEKDGEQLFSYGEDSNLTALRLKNKIQTNACLNYSYQTAHHEWICIKNFIM